jgi:hypothetical protein
MAQIERVAVTDGAEAGRGEMGQVFSTVIPHLHEMQRRGLPKASAKPALKLRSSQSGAHHPGLGTES